MRHKTKISISYVEVSDLLQIDSMQLRYLMLNDLSFPKPLQAGTANRPTLFDYAAVVHWYKQTQLIIQLQGKFKQA